MAEEPQVEPVALSDFADVRRKSRYGAQRVRLAAVRRLAEYGPEALEPLVASVQKDYAWQVREAAVRSLGELGGSQVFPALHAALKDSETPVRAAAAEVLGRIGDESAVQPLIEALRANFVGRTARRQRLLAIFAASLFAVWLGLMVVRFFVPDVGRELILATFIVQFGAQMVVVVLGARKERATFLEAAADALTRIAERHPCPALRQAVPDLQVVAGDRSYPVKSAREASRRAAERIAALTADVHALPMPVKPAEEGSLPLPAKERAEGAATATQKQVR